MKTKIILSFIASALVVVTTTELKAQSTLATNTLSGTVPNPTQYLGSANTYDVIFKSNGSEKMRIINNTGNLNMPGNLNIGQIINTNQSPNSKVTINPASSINMTADNYVGLSIAKQITTSYSRAIFFVPHLNGGGYNSLPQTGDCGMFWTDGGNGVIGSGNQNATSGLVIAANAGSNAGIRIAANGNVGVGVSIPQDRLDVGGNIRMNNNTIYLRGAGDSNHGLAYRGLNPFAGQAIDGPVAFGWSGGALGTTSGGEKIALKWDQNGKVLIGNPGLANFQGTPGSYLLYVQQGILTEKVKVAVATTADWSDYVFANGYKLKSIKELEAFIKENNHLPNIPSAEEVVKEGVDMAKMDAKLLEKIEELALYVIQQQKEIELLKSKK